MNHQCDSTSYDEFCNENKSLEHFYLKKNNTKKTTSEVSLSIICYFKIGEMLLGNTDGYS